MLSAVQNNRCRNFDNVNDYRPITILPLSGLYPGQPGWAGTRRNIHPLTPIMSSIVPYLLPPSITIHGILSVQFTCMTVFFPQSPSKFSFVYLGLAPSTSYSIHFFTQSLSSFCSTCPYYNRNLFCCSSEIMSSNPSLPLNPLLETLSSSLTPHIHLTILISAHWSDNTKVSIFCVWLHNTYSRNPQKHTLVPFRVVWAIKHSNLPTDLTSRWVPKKV